MRNMISYKIIIVHKIKTYQLLQRNTHCPTLKPAQNSLTVAHRGDTEELENVILNNIPCHIESSMESFLPVAAPPC